MPKLYRGCKKEFPEKKKVGPDAWLRSKNGFEEEKKTFEERAQHHASEGDHQVGTLGWSQIVRYHLVFWLEAIARQVPCLERKARETLSRIDRRKKRLQGTEIDNDP